MLKREIKLLITFLLLNTTISSAEVVSAYDLHTTSGKTQSYKTEELQKSLDKSKDINERTDIYKQFADDVSSANYLGVKDSNGNYVEYDKVVAEYKEGKAKIAAQGGGVDMTNVINKHTKDFKNFGNKQNVDNKKSWKITFNHNVDRATMSGSNLKVVDSKGNEADVVCEPDNGNLKVWNIRPRAEWKSGESYAIVMKRGITTNLTSHRGLTKDVVLQFSVKGSSDKDTSGSITDTIATIKEIQYANGKVCNVNTEGTKDSYDTVKLDDVLDKKNVVFNIQKDDMTAKYNTAIDFVKSQQGLYSKCDVTPFIQLDSNNVKLVFNEDIDSSSVVKEKTVSVHSLEADTSLLNSSILKYNHVDNISVNGNVLELYLTDIEKHRCYVAINGIKTKSGKIIKPIIIPVVKCSNDKNIMECLQSNKSGDIDDMIQANTGTKYDRFSLEYSKFSKYSEYEKSINNNCPQYKNIFKHVYNNFGKYVIMQSDLFANNIIPKKTFDICENGNIVWERFTCDGYEVDVLGDSISVNLVIYKKGTTGHKNPNYFIPIATNEKTLPESVWEKNFNNSLSQRFKK